MDQREKSGVNDSRIFAERGGKKGENRKKVESYCHLLDDGRTHEERQIRKRRNLDGRMRREEFSSGRRE